MTKAVKAVPEDFHTVTPYMIVNGAAAAMDFYEKVFGAVEVHRQAGPDGKVRHGQIRIGDSMIMIADEFPEFPDWRGPEARGGSPMHLYLYVDDCDAMFNAALSAGASEVMPMQDQFYGDRSGGIKDPFGHTWYIATHKEDLSEDELAKRAAARGRG